MAEIQGRTSVSIQQLVDDNIVSGSVVGGHLLLETRGGAQIDAGIVTGSGISFSEAYPVGSIYMSVLSANPSTLFGGTWSRIGQGRVLVGQDSGQTEFDVAEETGGAKTHTLTAAELPAHAHTIDHDHASFNTPAGDGNHTHVLERKTAAGTSTGVTRGGTTASADGTTAAGGTHQHAIDVPAFTGNSGSIGSGTAHNNLQPYLVVYMWKRTA